MSKFPIDLLEETLKIKVRDAYFSKFYMSQIGRVDFAISVKKEIAFDLFLPNIDSFDNYNQYLLWAESKKGIDHDIYESIVQLILTIGKERTFEKNLPPIFLGAFDAEKIAFIEYKKIAHIFIQNDFNWNVAPSNHNTKEFKQLLNLTKDELKNRSLIFNYETQEKDLTTFISKNFKVSSNSIAKIDITINNFTSIYFKWLKTVKPTISIDWNKVKTMGLIDSDFYLADLFSDKGETIKDSLYVLLKSDHYEFCKKVDDFGLETISKASYNDNQEAHNLFWKIYKRPPKKDFWDYIIKRRDLLVPQDIRERKGSYFTPSIWVEKSQEYLSTTLGENWQDKYYIWDCCAGTGNLLNGLTDKYRIWASTIDQADVDIMIDRVKNGANLLKEHIFQFDFLNDEFSDPKLPQSLRDILNNEEERKKLIIYINPPYAEATSSKSINSKESRHKPGVSSSKIKEKYQKELNQGAKEVAVLFLFRIYKEISNSIIANFSTPKFLTGVHYREFLTKFTPKLLSMFIVPGNTFDNVKGKFPIGFFIWDSKIKENFNKVTAEVYSKEAILCGHKTFLKSPSYNLKDWLKEKCSSNKKDSNKLSYLVRGSCDVQNNNIVFLTQRPSDSVIEAGNYSYVTNENFESICVFYTVRKVIKNSWFINRDQYLYPSDFSNDYTFIYDCIIYTIFSLQSNNITCFNNNTNHFIPFKENEVNPRDTYKSHWLCNYLEKLDRNKMSEYSLGVIESFKTLYRLYHSYENSNPNASLYDIKNFFNSIKKRQGSISEEYEKIITEIKENYEILSLKIIPKIYEYKFLVR